MFRTRHAAILPFVSESVKRFASVTGNKLRFATVIRTRQGVLSPSVRRGRAAMGRRPEGLPSGERQKNARSGRACSHPDGLFLAFVLPQRLSTTPKTAPAAHDLEAIANLVPQPWVQGTQYPGSGVRGPNRPPEHYRLSTFSGYRSWRLRRSQATCSQGVLGLP